MLCGLLVIRYRGDYICACVRRATLAWLALMTIVLEVSWPVPSITASPRSAMSNPPFTSPPPPQDFVGLVFGTPVMDPWPYTEADTRVGR